MYFKTYDSIIIFAKIILSFHLIANPIHIYISLIFFFSLVYVLDFGFVKTFLSVFQGESEISLIYLRA